MAAHPTPQSHALTILHEYVHQRQIRPGDVFRRNSVTARLIGPQKMSEGDFNAGVAFAIQEGWLTPKTSESWMLTGSGYQAARES